MRLKAAIYSEKTNNQHFFKLVLTGLGLDNKYVGYYYLVKLLDMVVNRGIVSDSFYKVVYPVIGEYFNVSDLTIERNIRHMLKCCWCERMADKLRPFWNRSVRPTCKRFLSILQKYIIHIVNEA